MWQIWLNNELYGEYEDEWMAELVLDMLDITYPSRKKEVRMSFVQQITEPEIAKSTYRMYCELKEYFTPDDAMRILVAMISKGKGGSQ